MTNDERDWTPAIEAFLGASRFSSGGLIVTDLDGTAVHEHEGQTVVHASVARGLKQLSDRGHGVVINTLRFPLNIVKTFGRQWAAITDAPLPVVSLNGSQIGYISGHHQGDPVFVELQSFPLAAQDVGNVLASIDHLLDSGLRNLILFYYNRDWQQGEHIWVAQPESVVHVRGKYRSASDCFSCPPQELRARLAGVELCMMYLLVEEPGDKLMAYQHARPEGFVTQTGVNKNFGWNKVCSHLGVDPANCIGAGDTPMDTFLDNVGLSIHVGPLDLDFRGSSGTLRMKGPHELGAFLSALSQYNGDYA